MKDAFKMFVRHGVKLACFVTGTLLGMTISGTALAQECACQIPQQAVVGGIVGSVNALSGQVVLTKATGPVNAKTGSTISIGDKIAVGPQSSASVSLATCNLQLTSGSDLLISPVGENLCVAVTNAQQTGAGINKLGLATGIGVAVGLGLIVANSDSDNPPPVSP